jgi:beta-phosphoglucomutase-like phosphatase (HAD superfamily)
MLRRQIDHEAFDAAVFSLDAVAVDLGYGDVRPLPGAIAWIDRLREDDKRIGVTAGADRAGEALHLAGISDRVDVVVTGADPAARLRRALEQLGAVPDRTVVARPATPTWRRRVPRASSSSSASRAATPARSGCAGPAP